jgi:[ribosomal protein S5]-alanine N-acetyltransferase
MHIIKTPDFILRPWKSEDIDCIVKYANNKKIADNLTNAFPYPFTKKDAEMFVQKFSGELPVKAFAIEINEEFCGAISVFPQEDVHCKNAELGYWLAEPFWGKGIITEAVKKMIEYGFATWDITRIFARPFGSNIASHRVLEKAGMTLEARFEKAIYKNGEFMDELFYSILKK